MSTGLLRDCPHIVDPWPETPPPSALVIKISNFLRPRTDEVEALDLISRNPKPHRAEQILVHEGSHPDHVNLIVEGFACRYKLLPGGRRQILGYLIPGDLCNLEFALFNKPDHSVALLCDSRVVRIPTHRLVELLDRHPRIHRALSLAALIDNAILREWLLNIGQRDALQKLSHFFCEMEVRLGAIGRVDGNGSFELPVNQSALADTTGLSSVHVNRTLQRLRSHELIDLSHRRLTILDRDRLRAVAGFDETYLTVQPRRD
ncbi:MAG: Crp/Fnr family transcriptional regulator [Sphingomicrobium sp.]